MGGGRRFDGGGIYWFAAELPIIANCTIFLHGWKDPEHLMADDLMEKASQNDLMNMPRWPHHWSLLNINLAEWNFNVRRTLSGEVGRRMQLDQMMDEAGAVAHALRVLVVEDEFLIRVVVADHLRDRGFRVVEAFSADEAIGLLKGGVPVDVIFSDVRMPGDADGMDLLAFVRDTRPHVPVVMTSGHLTMEQAAAGGAAAFLAKPCDLDAVVEALRSVRNAA